MHLAFIELLVIFALVISFGAGACAYPKPAHHVRAHIDIVAKVTVWRQPLEEHTLQSIGEFTRENIARWLGEGLNEYGWEDFHAVYGDLDIPWATEEAKAAWADIQKWGWWPGDSIENSKCA